MTAQDRRQINAYSNDVLEHVRYRAVIELEVIAAVKLQCCNQ